MDDDPRLEMLHHDVETAADGLGLPIEGRPFRPHVTLARVPRRPAGDTLRALAGAARRAADDRFDTTIRSIDLMHSILGPAGPRYERLHSSPLRDA